MPLLQEEQQPVGQRLVKARDQVEALQGAEELHLATVMEEQQPVGQRLVKARDQVEALQGAEELHLVNSR
jgi:hypothetical protein